MRRHCIINHHANALLHPFHTSCITNHFISTTYRSIGIASKVLYIMHREQGKYLQSNVSVLSSLLVFGCEDVGGGDVSSSKCHTTWHTRACHTHAHPALRLLLGRKKVELQKCSFSPPPSPIYYLSKIIGKAKRSSHWKICDLILKEGKWLLLAMKQKSVVTFVVLSA